MVLMKCCDGRLELIQKRIHAFYVKIKIEIELIIVSHIMLSHKVDLLISELGGCENEGYMWVPKMQKSIRWQQRYKGNFKLFVSSPGGLN